MLKKLHKNIFLFFLFLSSSSYALEFNGKFIQGHFIVGKTDPKAKI